MATTKFDLDKMFSEPNYTPEQKEKIDAVRRAAKMYAEELIHQMPDGWAQTNALNDVKSSVSTAIYAISQAN